MIYPPMVTYAPPTPWLPPRPTGAMRVGIGMTQEEADAAGKQFAAAVAAGQGGAPATGMLAVYQSTTWQAAAMVSGLACAYHGYKRNNGSIGWAIGWWLLGGIGFPVVPVIAVAQGFGKPAVAKPNRRKRNRRRSRR